MICPDSDCFIFYFMNKKDKFILQSFVHLFRFIVSTGLDKAEQDQDITHK